MRFVAVATRRRIAPLGIGSRKDASYRPGRRKRISRRSALARHRGGTGNGGGDRTAARQSCAPRRTGCADRLPGHEQPAASRHLHTARHQVAIGQGWQASQQTGNDSPDILIKTQIALKALHCNG